MFEVQLVFHSVTLAKKINPPEFPQTRDEFPEEKGLHLVVPDAPPLPKDFVSPTVHTPRRAAPKIEQSLESPKYKVEEPITVGPKRLPDSPFPKPVSPTPYRRPGTPYRKVDPPGTEELVTETLGAEFLDKGEDSFEVDPERKKTLIEEPRTPKRNISDTPEGITKRKLAPVVLPFTDKGAKSKIESKAIVRLKKIDAKVDIEKRPSIDPKKLLEKFKHKGAETKKPEGIPGRKAPEITGKKLEVTKKLGEKSVKAAEVAPPAPILRSPVKTPPVSPVRTSSPSWSPSSSVPSSPVSPIVVGPVAMGTVEEIKNALIESNRVAAMPIPQFYGKKGEKPEDHIMKVEDYFQNYNIRDEAQKCNRFRDTCCGKARTWLSTLTEYPTIFDPEAAPDEAAKAKTMKSMFLARWQLKGRTPQTLYMEWQNLKFDPVKDDIEDFCNDVKNLANRLGYPEDAQVMAIKATLPPVLVTQVINIKTFKEIRDALITLVENPVIKRVLLTEGTGEKGLAPFSQMQWQPENDVGMHDPETRQPREEGARRTPKSLGKIINKIDNLELKMRKMTLSEDKPREPPYKPQVAPPRRRGGTRFRGSNRNPKSTLTTSSRGSSGFKRNNGRPQNSFQNSSRGRFSERGRFQRNGSSFRGRGRFDKSPNVSRPRVASKTVSRDATRCYYCKEPGHISRFCDRREEDERRLKRGSNMMASDSQFEIDEGYENYDGESMEYLNN